MADPFSRSVLKLRELGFFQFVFPFMLTSAIFYGLLRKSKIFGEPEKNVAVNAVVALVAAFMVWSYPVITGVNIESQLATFFMQGMSATLTMLVGLLITSMFLGEDVAKQLDKLGGKFTGGVLILGILVGASIIFSSGLVNVFIPQNWQLTEDVWAFGIVAVLVVGVIIIVVMPQGGKTAGS